MNRSVHELEVSQIELEMQNDELVASRAETEVSLDRYAALFDSGPVGYLTLNRGGAVNSVSVSGASLLGVVRSRVLGRHFRLFVAPESRPAFAVFLDQVFRSRTKVTCELALLQEGKAGLFVQLAAKVAESGLECNIALIDMTERKSIEDTLRETECRYASLFANKTNAIGSLDKRIAARQDTE